MTVPEILHAAADTYEERNKVYGDNYKNVGNVMAALFPGGTGLLEAADFNRFHLLELIVVKLTRFVNAKLQHRDSIHDIAVYAAMLESLVEPDDQRPVMSNLLPKKNRTAAMNGREPDKVVLSRCKGTATEAPGLWRYVSNAPIETIAQHSDYEYATFVQESVVRRHQ